MGFTYDGRLNGGSLQNANSFTNVDLFAGGGWNG